MKKGIWCFLLFLLLLFSIYGSELLYSYWIKKENNLEENILIKEEYDTLKKEYDELLNFYELWEENKIEGTVSKVILRDPYTFFDKITILKGSEEGINAGDVVLNEKGFIGEVIRTGHHFSEVELFTSRNSKLSVKIKNSYGILSKEQDELIVKNITSKEEIQNGDLVTTSNFSDLPPDIPIGIVEEVKASSIEQTLKIKPLISLNEINYVIIRKKVTYE